MKVNFTIIQLLVAAILHFHSMLVSAQSAPVLLPVQIIDGDSMIFVELRQVNIFPPLVFKNKRHKRHYGRLVRDVKKTLPYARMASALISEMNDSLISITSERERKKYLKVVEKKLFDKFEKKLRRLSFSQGRLLLKLIDRECEQTSFEIVKLYRGNFSAFFWQTVARVFGSDLKSEYDAYGSDELIERVVTLVDNGQL